MVRNIYGLTAILLTFWLCSCKDLDEGGTLPPGEVAFTVGVSLFDDVAPGVKSASAAMPLKLVSENGEDTITILPSVGQEWPAVQFVPEDSGTKGARIAYSSDISALGLYIYNGSETYAPNAKFMQGTAYWTGIPSVNWPGTGTLDFQAYAPYGCGASITTKGQLYYKVTCDKDDPSDGKNNPVGNQLDLLVAETNNVPGSGSVAPQLTFEHALTSIRFIAGQDMSAGVLKSITFKNVYSDGTYRFSEGDWILSGSPTDFTQELNMRIYNATDVYHSRTYEITPSDMFFFMMPQTLPSGAKLQIVFNDGLSDIVLAADIGGTIWKKGQVVTYELSTSSVKTTFSIRAESYSSDEHHLYVTANRNGSDIPWELQEPYYAYPHDKLGEYGKYPYDDAMWIWRDEYVRENGNQLRLQDDGQLGTDGLVTSATTGYLTSTSIGSRPTASHPASKFINDDLADYHFGRLGNTQDTPLDLSRAQFDSSLEGGGYPVYSAMATNHTTANCYMINAAGWYCFPVVPGNAFKDGLFNNVDGNGVEPMASFLKDNTDHGVFQPSGICSVDTLWLQSTHVGISGQTAYTYNKTSAEYGVYYGYSGQGYIHYLNALQREDVTYPMTGHQLVLPENLVELTGLSLMDGTIGRNGIPCKYVRFYINPRVEDNVLIAVKNASGEIVWSWHIWVVMSDNSPLYQKNHTYRKPVTGPVVTSQYEGCTGNQYRLLNRRLGELAVTYRYLRSPLDIIYRISTPGSGAHLSAECSVLIPGVDAWVSSQVLVYQFGRKDPLFISNMETIQSSILYKRIPRSYLIDIHDINAPENFNYDPADELKVTARIADPQFISAPLSLLAIIQNPTKMMPDASYSHYTSWWSGHQFSSEEYAAEVTSKTIFDPCPVGYRVPVADAFRSFTPSGQPVRYTSLDDDDLLGCIEKIRQDVNFKGYSFLYEDTYRRDVSVPFKSESPYSGYEQIKLSSRWDIPAPYVYDVPNTASSYYKYVPTYYQGSYYACQEASFPSYWSSLFNFEAFVRSNDVSYGNMSCSFYPLSTRHVSIYNRVVPMAE